MAGVIFNSIPSFDYNGNLPDLKAAFGGVYIANEKYTPESAQEAVRSGDADAVAFGKLFISNPDLPRRLETNAALNEWNAATFYAASVVKLQVAEVIVLPAMSFAPETVALYAVAVASAAVGVSVAVLVAAS